MSTSIVMICPCYFVDDKGQKVEYYRALVRTVDNGGVKYTLEKCCKDIKGLDDDHLSCDCLILYDRYGRICSVDFR